MKLVTFDHGEGAHVGALYFTADTVTGILPLTEITPDMLSFIAAGAPALARAHDLLATVNGEDLLPIEHCDLLAPIPHPPRNIICLGLNYAEHAYESARAAGKPEVLPEHPIFFTKATTAINHPGGAIPYRDDLTRYMDWEVELAFVIGRGGKDIAAADAMQHVYGYTIVNDISLRDLQKRHVQFYRGKSMDGTAPLGPCLVTADEIPDPHALRLTLRVNGTTMQDSTTADMIFKLPQIIALLSQGATLQTGDIIATGTPSGVGMGLQPPRYLQPGDVVEAEIAGIGILQNTVETVEVGV